MIDAFVERLERRLAERNGCGAVALERKREHQNEIVLGSMAISIPLVCLALGRDHPASPVQVAAIASTEAVVAGSRLPSAPLHLRCLCRPVCQETGRGGMFARQL